MLPRIPHRISPLKHPIYAIATRRLRTGPRLPAQQPPQQPPGGPPTSQQPEHDAQKPPQPSMASLLAQTNDADNSLLAPVHIPEDPNAVLKSEHPARNILAESGIVVQRQIEMMNLFIGFEQANRYVILDPHGNHIGYMAEHEGGIGKSMSRQFLGTHRPFTTNIFDRHGKEVLRFNRPFSYINSTIRVYDPLETGTNSKMQLSTGTTLQTSNDLGPLNTLSQLPLDAMRIIGEAKSIWAPLRRKYELFLAHELPPESGIEPLSTTSSPGAPTMVQFAKVDEPFLSWDFSLKGASDQLIGSVNRSFRGFAREIFTDTGAYVMRMDAAGLEQEAAQNHIVSQTNREERAYAETLGASNATGMTLDQRAVMLATAVTVDYDYFSRHSHGSGGMLPFMMMGGGEAGGAAGGAAAGEAAAGAGAAGAGEVGAAVGGAGRAVGGATAVGGMGEGAIAGAGTMAGYEAMQRGMGRGEDSSPAQQPPPMDDASPQAPGSDYGQQPYDYQSPQSGMGGQDGDQDVWGAGQDPWAEGKGEMGSSSGGDGEGGGGLFSQLWESFFDD
jgi:hypothetical protein